MSFRGVSLKTRACTGVEHWNVMQARTAIATATGKALGKELEGGGILFFRFLKSMQKAFSCFLEEAFVYRSVLRIYLRRYPFCLISFLGIELFAISSRL
jgi:hypothetical protein